MNINDAFPSKYISRADLNSQDVTVTIASVTLEEIDDENRPIARFTGAQKGMVINKTNWEAIAFLLGEDSALWIGKTITLYDDPTIMYGGKRVGGIRVRPQPPWTASR